MELIKFEWDWKFVLTLFTFVLFTTIVSFEMIAEWEKKKTTDLKTLIIGSAIFGGVLITISARKQVAVLSLVVIITLSLAGLLASEEELDNGKKPWELYFIAIVSLFSLFGTIAWALYNTDKGQAVRDTASKAYVSLKQKKRKQPSSSFDFDSMEMDEF